MRRRIEDVHRVLESGCRIEALQDKTAVRLERAIAVHRVDAGRIMPITLPCPPTPSASSPAWAATSAAATIGIPAIRSPGTQSCL